MDTPIKLRAEVEQVAFDNPIDIAKLKEDLATIMSAGSSFPVFGSSPWRNIYGGPPQRLFILWGWNWEDHLIRRSMMKKGIKFLIRFLGIEEGMDAPYGDELDEDLDCIFQYRYDEKLDGLGSKDSSDVEEDEEDEVEMDEDEVDADDEEAEDDAQDEADEAYDNQEDASDQHSDVRVEAGSSKSGSSSENDSTSVSD